MDGDRPLLSAAIRCNKMGAIDEEDDAVRKRAISFLIAL